MPDSDRHGRLPAIQIDGLRMKVIHRSDQLLVIEDRPWFIGILMIGMTLIFLFGSMKLFAAGEAFGGLMMLLVGGGVPLLIGAVMVRRVRLTFDRSQGAVTRTSRSVGGLTREVYALDRVETAQLGTSTDSDGTTYRTELRLRDPSEIVPFTSYYTDGRKPERMAEAVNGWLTAPDQVQAPPKAAGGR